MTRFILLLALLTTLAQSAPSPKEVKLQAGQTTTLTGSLQGAAVVDYQVQVRAGQSLTVTLACPNKQAYFNVTPAGSSSALYIGSLGGTKMPARRLPADGNYVVRVYLMRAAADRNEKASYKLTLALSGEALKALPATSDATVPGTLYHATAEVPCRYYLDSALKTCPAGVIRRGSDGTATVELKLKDLTRHILFVKGQPVASDSAEPMKVKRDGERVTVTFGEDSEIYTIPDVFLTGD